MSPPRPKLPSVAGFTIGFAVGLWLFGSCLGCGAAQRPAVCETACGMRLVSPVPAQAVYDGGTPDERGTYGLPWWTCDNLQGVESQALRVYSDTAAPHDPRFQPRRACEALNGVEIHVRQDRAWFDKSNNESVVGLTHCNGIATPWIEIGNREPDDGTLTHEMAHAIQGCAPLGPKPLVGQDPTYDQDSDESHLNWARDGIKAGILDVELVDVAATMRRDSAIFACGEDAGCFNATYDAGSVP